jgi:hypothetical protein
MKNIFKTFGLALITALAFAACSPESFDGANGNLPLASDYDGNFGVTVDQETNTANFTFTSAQGVTPIWIIDGAYSSAYSLSKYYRKAGDYTVECKVKNANGISDGSVTKTFHVNKTKINGFGGFVEDSEYNLFKNATFEAPHYWYAPGWSQIADPTCAISKGSYAVTLPAATTDQWQAQMFVPTNVALKAGKHYDFSCILTSSVDHPNVTVKLGSVSKGDFSLLYKNPIKLSANEPLCVYVSDAECTADINDLELIFDFGGNAANTVINLESFVIKDHDNDDGTVLPSAAAANFVYNSVDNLWLPVDKNSAYTTAFYYAPGWNPIPNPTFTADNGTYSVSLPTATNERWQSQVTLIPNDLKAEADQDYDFSVTIHSDKALATVTAKVVDTANNKLFLDGTDVAFAVPADGDFKIQVAKKRFNSASPHIQIVFDFGGNPANTNVKMSEIILQKHKE